MNLLEIRKQFIKLSGRYDLVKDREEYKDNGADFFIKAGQKFLDTLLDTPNSSAVYPIDITAGDYLLTVPEARAVEAVRIENSSDGVAYLTKKNIKWLREEYGSETTIADSDKDTPKYYSFITFRDFKQSDEERISKGVIILPRTDKAYTVYVEGKFYSRELKNEKAVNWWSEVYPHSLVQAGLFMLERFYRNREGMADHLTAIQQDVQGIDNDVVEQMIADIDQMADSFNIPDHKQRKDYGFGANRVVSQ